MSTTELHLAGRGLDALRNTCFTSQADYDAIFTALKRLEALEGRSTLQPIPVAERPWERDGFCNAEDMCWWWHPDHKEDEFTDGWMLRDPKWADSHHDSDNSPVFTYCLPAHALPLPEVEG